MVDIRNYAIVTSAYWGFTLTDGALRMLVLLHFHRLGFSPVQLAYLFVLYEIAGVVTNLCAGWIAARWAPLDSARSTRPGWSSWGNEIDKFGEAAA